METGIRFRHVVSLAGVVRDTSTHDRIAGALVQIVNGPPAFEVLRTARATDKAAWDRHRERLDRVYTRQDGSFYFTDLPPGAYRLDVSVPALMNCYEEVKGRLFNVQEAAQGKARVTQADIEVPSTRVRGTVVNAATKEPVAGARLRLLSSGGVAQTGAARTGANGAYDLGLQTPGQRMLEVTAPGYQQQTCELTLERGRECDPSLVLLPVVT